MENEFDIEKIDKILDRPSWDSQYSEKLQYAREFMTACANCLNLNDNKIIDSQKLLLRFEEVFLASLKIMEEFSTDLAERVKDIDAKLQLSHNAIKLSMLSEKYTKPSFWELLLKALFKISIQIQGISLDFPDRGKVKLSEEILIEIRAAFYRIGGLFGTAASDAKKWYYENEDVLVVEGYYDPRRIPKEYLLFLLQKAKQSVEIETQIPSKMKDTIIEEISGVEKELKKSKTSWNKVCSKITQIVMLLGALITISANIDEAYENVEKAYKYAKSAMSYIAENAISLPRLKELSIDERKSLLLGNKNDTDNEAIENTE